MKVLRLLESDLDNNTTGGICQTTLRVPRLLDNLSHRSLPLPNPRYLPLHGARVQAELESVLAWGHDLS